MPSYHYAVTVTLTEGDDLDPAFVILDALSDRVERVEIEPLGEDDVSDVSGTTDDGGAHEG